MICLDERKALTEYLLHLKGLGNSVMVLWPFVVIFVQFSCIVSLLMHCYITR